MTTCEQNNKRNNLKGRHAHVSPAWGARLAFVGESGRPEGVGLAGDFSVGCGEGGVLCSSWPRGGPEAQRSRADRIKEPMKEGGSTLDYLA